MADEKLDQSFGGQTIGPADGKDVLYGWLIGRAAADLGLAQAIAASEAQRVDEIRRLEEALLGQMRERQNSQAAAESASDSAAVDLLQDQVRQFSERQNALEAQQLTSGQIEAQLAAKIRELEAVIEQPPTAIANPEVSALRAQIAELVQRIADAETAASRQLIPVDTRLAQEQIALAVGAQTEALKTQLIEQLQRQTAGDDAFTALESSVQKKLDGLQQEIREKAALLRLREGELSDVRVQLVGVAKRLDYVAATPPPEVSASEREAQRAQWEHDFDQRLTARLRELGDEIRAELHGVKRAKVDQEQFRGETLALTARIAQLEQSNQNASAGAAAEARQADQAALAMRAEIAGLKTALLEQQAAQPNDALMRSVEAMLQEQIQEVHNQIAQHQRATLEWQNQFKVLPGDIQALAQRQIQAETLAQQTHARVTQETAQIRGVVKADIAAVEAQLNERRERDGALQGLEEAMSGRLRALHHQLAQGMLAFDQRDGELRDLKTQVQTLAQQMGQNGSPPLPVRRPDGLAESGAAAPFGGLAATLPAVEPPPVLTPGSLDSGANLFQPALPGNGAEQFKVAGFDLHERLSAEIERKRAELREKSGRWKVRQ